MTAVVTKEVATKEAMGTEGGVASMVTAVVGKAARRALGTAAAETEAVEVVPREAALLVVVSDHQVVVAVMVALARTVAVTRSTQHSRRTLQTCI